MFSEITPFHFQGKSDTPQHWKHGAVHLAQRLETHRFYVLRQSWRSIFYATSCDILTVFQQLELQNSMRYWCGKEIVRFDHFQQLFSERFHGEDSLKTFHAIDIDTHNTIDITLGGVRADMRNVVAPGMITYMSGCPKYGGTLLRN